MKKSVIYTLIAVVILGAIAAGLWWFYQNTGAKLLQKAELAIKANRCDKALVLADKYIADNPKDWHGYYTKARAYYNTVQYEEARHALDEAVKADPREMSVYILMAESYAAEARKALTSKRLSEVQDGVNKYDKAQKVLTDAVPADQKQLLDVLQELGTEQIEHAGAEQWYAAQLDEDALAAEVRRDKDTEQKRLAQSKEARNKAQRILAEATGNLLKVVTQDPKRGEAGTRLVELCLERQDDKSLNVARKAIMSMDDPTPVAAMMLVMHELQSSDTDESRGPVNRRNVTKACQVLDDILKRHPENTQVKLARAELAMRLGDQAGTWKYCEEILQVEPKNPRARLAMAELLIDKGEVIEAEKQLLNLSKEFPNWPDSQLAYARLALAIGKSNVAAEALNSMGKIASPTPRVKLMEAELALVLSDLSAAQKLVDEVLLAQPNNAMALLLRGNILATSGQLDLAQRELAKLAVQYPRWAQAQLALAQVCGQTQDSGLAIDAAQAAVNLDNENAQARKLLASLLLREGRFARAFEEAKACVKAHPDDPAAIRLYIDAAERNNHTDLALALLDKSMTDYKDKPEVLMAVADGYRNLSNQEKAVKAAKLVLECKTSTTQSHLAMVRALVMLDRMPEAEKTLFDEMRKDTGRADLHFQMGQICASTGRMLPAIDQLRQAVDLDRNNVGYRVSLARAMLDSGDLGEAAKTLQTVDTSNPTAYVLRLQIQLIQGQQVDMEQMLSHVQGAERSAISIAIPYLAGGQLQQCVDYCVDELKKTPDDADLRLLLGRALLAQGQQEKGIQQWELVLQKAPDRLSTYLELASILGRDQNVDQVMERMSRIPGARTDMINLAIGRMVASVGDYEKAANILARVANRSDAPEHVRGRACLLLAQSLAQAGQAGQAVTELEKLSASPIWRKDAMFGKAQLLAMLKQTGPFEAVLSDLRNICRADKDTAMLRNIAELYATNARFDLALVVCDELTAIAPDDSRNYRVRAAILNLQAVDEDKKPGSNNSDALCDEAIKYFDKAIELQPRNFSLYLAEAQILNRQGKFVESLGILRKLEENGSAAAVIAAFQRGRLFAAWGLQDQAADQFGKLSSLGYSGNPQVKLALGQAFALLGKFQDAGKYLESIPPFAEEYVPAQLLLAQMAGDIDGKLRIFRKLQTIQPLNESVLVECMAALGGAGRMDEVVKTFQEFISQPKVKVLPEGASFLALQAMLARGHETQARELALRAMKDHLQPRWRLYAALLSLDTDPVAAARMLPPIDKADFHSALMLFYVACKSDDKAARDSCLSRLDDLLRQAKSSESLVACYRVLIDIAVRNDRAKADAGRIRTVWGFGRGVADELLSSAANNPKAPQEALALLKAGIAQSMSLLPLSQLWAQEILRSRPTCQWAAALGVMSDLQSDSCLKFLSILEPRDCPIALAIQSQILRNRKKYGQAADLMAQACRVDNTPAMLLNWAADLEYADKPDQAADLYRRVWDVSRDPSAANNAAYIALAIHPTDKAKVAEAQDLIEKAIAQTPDNPDFRDTVGWIYFLQGQYERACTELRKAVKGQPQSPEVHYHLGMAESACGRMDLARWHLSAAVNIGKAVQARQGLLTAQLKQTFDLAQKALKLLGPEQ